MKLALAFVTYNESSLKYLRYFLPSLKRALQFLDENDYKIYVFDNSDKNDKRNLELLKDFNNKILSSSQHSLEIIAKEENLGFSKAYNILINSARKDGAEYFFIVNPDVILDPDSLSYLASALDNNSNLDSVCPKILRWDFKEKRRSEFIDSLGLILQPALQFKDLGQGEIDKGQFDDDRIIGPSGAAGLFRVSALKEIAFKNKLNRNWQYFDENFFMYKEDCDLAYRLFITNHRSALISQSIIYHDRTAALSGRGIYSKFKDRRLKSRQIKVWSFRNQHYLFFKHWSKQNIVNKMKIILRVVGMFIFVLILERFLLKEYYHIFRSCRTLTNTK